MSSILLMLIIVMYIMIIVVDEEVFFVECDLYYCKFCNCGFVDVMRFRSSCEK